MRRLRLMAGTTTGHLASLAIEVWRASGPRTLARLDALVQAYAITYSGPIAGWRADHHEALASAQHEARSLIRSWDDTIA